MQKCPEKSKLIPGARIRLSPLGIKRCHRLKSHTGLIISINPGGTSFRVLLDGRKLPLTLHQSYVEPESGIRMDGS
jgi:hypothetical protein